MFHSSSCYPFNKLDDLDRVHFHFPILHFFHLFEFYLFRKSFEKKEKTDFASVSKFFFSTLILSAFIFFLLDLQLFFLFF